ETVTFQPAWSPGSYSTIADPEWTVGDLLRFEAAKHADIGTYTSYEVTVSLQGKSRQYRAMVLFHDLRSTTALGTPQFVDLIVDGLHRVWTEARPPYEPQVPPSTPNFEMLMASNQPAGIGVDLSSLTFDDGPVNGIVETSDLRPDGFWLTEDDKDHASGSHKGT